MAENNTVRAASRRTAGTANGFDEGDSVKSDFSAAPRAEEAKRSLMRRMKMVFTLALILLAALFVFDYFNQADDAALADSSTDSALLSPDLQKEEIEESVETLDSAESADSAESEEYDEAPTSSNTHVVEQTVTESGEIILKISPQQHASPAANTTESDQKPSQKNQKTTQRMEIVRIDPIEAEDSANLPMVANTSPGLPTQQESNQLARMPSNRFHVQAGIFVENERARTLYQRLVSAGIPTVLESRVQVGPFTTRREAEGARQQLKSMGIDSIVVAPSS